MLSFRLYQRVITFEESVYSRDGLQWSARSILSRPTRCFSARSYFRSWRYHKAIFYMPQSDSSLIDLVIIHFLGMLIHVLRAPFGGFQLISFTFREEVLYFKCQWGEQAMLCSVNLISLPLRGGEMCYLPYVACYLDCEVRYLPHKVCCMLISLLWPNFLS